MSEHSFTLGIEEEYLLIDQETLDLVAAPEQLMTDCASTLGDQVSPEFLQCQIEVGTGVCETVADARADLASLRKTIHQIANGYGLAPLAVSTHPFAMWQKQDFTDRERYRSLEKDLAGVARRMLIGGMHVHVGISDDDLRCDLMNQFSYFLPHLLALSTSSPFWEGEETGLRSYRLTVFDNLPRTGLPPHFQSYGEYRRSIQSIIDTKVIEDATKIWWDLRPSDRFPTLETRICDVSPLLDDTMAIAAMIQSLMRMLYSLRCKNQRWRIYDRFLVAENRWRAVRYGASQGLIDFGVGKIMPFADLIEELIEMVSPHAEELGCLDELLHLRNIIERGTSADRQTATYHTAMKNGASSHEALRAVVEQLAQEFTEGL
ncbi:MAG: carboxylate-amine ligase [Silicimonas sp.]|nr:carboxylate-amine ligase [Silicimonas sp.]